MITTDKLKPWQIAPANHLYDILQRFDSALDSSDTGTGKTYTAIAIAQALQLPTLAVVPKISITGWKTVCEHFGEKISVCNYEQLSTGKTPFGNWTGQRQVQAGRPVIRVCSRCQRSYPEGEALDACPYDPEGQHDITLKRGRLRHGHFVFNSAVKFIIFDEAQRCGALDSLNSKILIAAKRQHIKTLMLSATPFDTILRIKAIGYHLDLFTL